MTSDYLRALADAATPGTWTAKNGKTYLPAGGWWVDGPDVLSHFVEFSEADARLMALGPDAARWMADAAEWIEGIADMLVTVEGESATTDMAGDLLARFAHLGDNG